MENITFPCSLADFTAKTTQNHKEADSRYKGHIQGLEKHTSQDIKYDDVSEESVYEVLQNIESELTSLNNLLTTTQNKQTQNAEELVEVEKVLKTKTDTTMNEFKGDVKLVPGAGIEITTNKSANTIEIRNTKVSGGGAIVPIEIDRYAWSLDFGQIATGRTNITICALAQGMKIKSNVPLRCYDNLGAIVQQVVGGNVETVINQNCTVKTSNESDVKVFICRSLE